jgi:O-antigen/teichoic acid export membrane protein
LGTRFPPLRGRALVGNAGWNAASWIALGILAFASSAIIFRRIGQESYGIWATVAAFRAFVMFLDGGLALGVSRDAARVHLDGEDAQPRLASARLLYLLLGASAAVIGIVASDLPGALLHLGGPQRQTAQYVTVLAALDTGLALSMSPLAALLRGRSHFRILAIGSSIQAVAGIGLILALTPPLGLVGSAGALLMARALSGGWYAAWLWKRERALLKIGSSRKHREVLRFAAPVWVIAAATQIGVGTDVPIVGAFYGPSAASAYAIGALLPAMAAGLLFVLIDSSFPRLAAAAPTDLGGQIERLLLAGCMFAGLGFGTLALNGGAVITAWVGRAPPLSVSVLALYTVSRALNVPAHVLTIGAIARAQHRILALLVIAEGSVSFLLSLLLAATWSPLGPAVATLGTLAFSNLIAVPVLLLRRLGLGWPRTLRATLAGGVGGVLCAIPISAAAGRFQDPVLHAIVAGGMAALVGGLLAAALLTEAGARGVHGLLHGGSSQLLRESLETVAARRRLARRRAAPIAWIPGEPPLVSVRIATYNRGQLIVDRAIESVLRQTHQNFEIVIVGDHCDAATESAVRSVHDPRIRFENLPARGQYPADPRFKWMVAGSTPMNRALDLVRGDWIAPLDDDDEFTTDHIEVLLEACRERNLEFAYGVAEMEYGPADWRPVGSWPLQRGAIIHASVLYTSRLGFLRYNEESWRLGEPADWNLWRRMRAAGITMGFVPQVVCRHYQEARGTDPRG